MRKVVLALGGLFVLIQFAPYGRDHSNPPITREPQWNSTETRATFDRACADCHSHRTTWPWYSQVAPVSWMIQRHVDGGRANFNTSAVISHDEGHEAAEEVTSHAMPPKTYLLLHDEARLSDVERKAFAIGLDATFGRERGHGTTKRGLGERLGYGD